MPSTVVRDPSPARADSSVPPTEPRRNPKRTASQALLLTPPRTVKTKRRTGKRTITRTSNSKSRNHTRNSGPQTEHEASDDEKADARLGDGAGRRLDFGASANKKRRLEDLDARLETLLESFDGEDPENPFWDGPSKAGTSEAAGKAKTNDVKKRTDKTVRLRSPTPPLLNFHGKAPVSPPPSNRRRKGMGTRGTRATTVETVVEETIEETVEEIVEAAIKRPEVESAEESAEAEVEAAVEPPAKAAEVPQVETQEEPPAVEELPPMPSTPKKNKGKGRSVESPVRDSGNNPFLEDSPSSAIGEPAEPRTPVPRVEKPTITYVFRGVRAEFANPMYNLPPEVHEHSLLPIEHPDYSPDPACPPKLLFTKPRKRAASPSSPTRAGRSKLAKRSKPAKPSPHSDNEWDDSDDEELHLTPPKRLFH